MIRPNLYILGFQKCGSSSLFDLLTQHPEITGTQPKETFVLTDPDYEHYDELRSVNSPDFDWPSEFQEPIPKSRYYLEASVCNFYQETALEYISGQQSAKVVFILRDPVERFISTFKYYGASGVHLKPGTDLESYYQLVKNRVLTKAGMQHALEHGKYCRFINRWEEALGKDRVFILGLRPLIRNTKSQLNQLEKFLDLSLDKVNLKHKNKSRSYRYKVLNRALVRTFGGHDLGRSWLGRKYKRWNQKEAEKVAISEELKVILTNYYQEEYENLSCFF